MEEINAVEKIEGGEEVGGDFYEEIEAPKFVDFTAPDHYRPDDRYWFCLRVGCDQKHEEEMDPEAIYKSFLLRVMAARSPNLRLRKGLSASMKCPLTAPAKSSKCKVASRLALISSFSKKTFDPKLKSRPSTVKTPNCKAKKESSNLAKALTTPRNRNRISNPNTFQSVRNPKKTLVATVDKNRTVAKALVFHSPKKNAREKPSREVKNNTPVRTLCQAMKKLEITNNGKVKSSIWGREVKSRVFDTLSSCSQKGTVVTCSRPLKRRCKEEEIREKVEDGSSDMEIDLHSRDGSLEQNGCEEKVLGTVKISKKSSSDENTSILSSDSEVKDSSECSGSGKSEVVLGEPDDEKTSGDDFKENDDKENDKENEGKENDNRGELTPDNLQQHEKVILGKHETSNKTLKGNVINKALKKKTGSRTQAVVKYKKPKPTNPKPFRLRTDERRILKEANSEKKLKSPSQEVGANSRLEGEKLKKEHQNNTEEVSETKSHGRKVHENKLEKIENLSMTTPRKCHASSIHNKPSHVTSQPEHNKDRAIEETEESSKKRIKSQNMQHKIARPQWYGSSKKVVVSSPITHGHLLSGTKETKFTTDSRQKEGTKKLIEIRGKRAVTIPKEPVFHNLHVPKSCTRKLIS